MAWLGFSWFVLGNELGGVYSPLEKRSRGVVLCLCFLVWRI